MLPTTLKTKEMSVCMHELVQLFENCGIPLGMYMVRPYIKKNTDQTRAAFCSVVRLWKVPCRMCWHAEKL